METNMIALEQENLIEGLTGERNVQWCSMNPANAKEKATLFNAMSNPTHRISDCINMNFKLVHVFCEIVQLESQQTGERMNVPRIVLIDDKGESYSATSFGIYNAVKKIMQVFGTPDTWEKPIEVAIKQVTRGERKTLTLELK